MGGDIERGEHFTGVAQPEENYEVPPPLWGSARLCYTICAFFSIVLHLCLRSTFNFAILCMVQPQVITEFHNATLIESNDNCTVLASHREDVIERTGNLLWKRDEEFLILGAFYWLYTLALPIGGMLADKLGGKHLFIHSLTLQSVVFMLMPYFARKSFIGAVVIRVTQGYIAGFGNAVTYQLFSTWAHPTERTTFTSIAYAGCAVGMLLTFPISSFLCQFGWEWVFYSIGCVSLIFGICCNWLVYSSLEEHPRLSQAEFDYLGKSRVQRSQKIPWKGIFSSGPIYAFLFTHIFHNYGLVIISLFLPIFFKEAMGFSFDNLGLISALPFMGAICSKIITIISSKVLGSLQNLNTTKYRRPFYVLCNLVTIAFCAAIVVSSCNDRTKVAVYSAFIGMTTDMGFSVGYWPALLYLAPSYAGVLSGVAGFLGTVSGILTPKLVSTIVVHGTKREWNWIIVSMIAANLLGAVVFGSFGNSTFEPLHLE